MKKTMLLAAIAAGAMLWRTPCAEAQTPWYTTGNAGTAGMNFIGTTDSKSLRFRTDNKERMTLSHRGRLGINNTAPKYRLDAKGGGIDSIYVINALIGFTGAYDAIAINGTSAPQPGFGIGINGTGGFIGCAGTGDIFGVAGLGGLVGTDGESVEAGNTLNLTGVQGITDGGNSGAGVYGTAVNALANYGVYGEQTDTMMTNNFAVVSLGDFFYWRAFIPSDARLKKDIEPYGGALEKISKLHAAFYTFDHEGYPGMALPWGRQVGFMAEDVESVFPELIKNTSIPAGRTTDKRGRPTYHSIPDMKVVNYIGLIPVLTEAIGEQKQIVEAQRAEITGLQEQLATLESRLAALESASRSTGALPAGRGSLDQNQPNPFNQATAIRYSLPENAGSAVLTVTDMKGQTVKSMTLNGRGDGIVTIHAGELAAGTYTYSLLVDGAVIDTKTMVLTK